MSEEKKEEVEVRDLKPSKDAKGGRRGRHVRRESGGQGDRPEPASRGLRSPP
jgi:hypothetical protein